MSDFFSYSQYDPNTSVTANTATDQANDNKNITNVTVSQIVKLTRREDGLVIHRQKIHNVVCIGAVVSVEELTTKNIYVIDDGTLGGPVEIQFWKNENQEESILPPPVMERNYIRVIGQARYDDRKPFVVAFRIESIDDPNDIYCHFLEALNDSLFLEKRLNVTLNSKSNFDGNSSMFGFDANGPSFSEIQRSVMNILNQHGRDLPNGLKRHEIKSFLANVSSKSVDDAIAFLVNEGHIFSTADEDTFKSTEY